MGIITLYFYLSLISTLRSNSLYVGAVRAWTQNLSQVHFKLTQCYMKIAIIYLTKLFFLDIHLFFFFL